MPLARGISNCATSTIRAKCMYVLTQNYAPLQYLCASSSTRTSMYISFFQCAHLLTYNNRYCCGRGNISQLASVTLNACMLLAEV